MGDGRYTHEGADHGGVLCGSLVMFIFYMPCGGVRGVEKLHTLPDVNLQVQEMREHLAQLEEQAEVRAREAKLAKRRKKGKKGGKKGRKGGRSKKSSKARRGK